MPRELVTIQVGQCGNQVGKAFWLRVLAEHARQSAGIYDEALSSFFRNVDARFEPASELPLGSPLSSLRARALLIDMEEGPVSEMLRSDIGELFDSAQSITDVSGSGNNFAHGFGYYGPRYGAEILEQARRALEECDSPQSFLLLHSLGGGTGSGLGSFVLGALEDAFPEIYRLDCCVMPSAEDDVVTSPYNALLGLRELGEHADAVLPLENGALAGIVERYGSPDADKAQGFARMNDLAGRVISDLTSSMRFPGDLNVDLNEVTTNLVPFPRMQFLMCSLSPFGSKAAPKGRRRAPGGRDVAVQRPRSIREIFQDVLQPYHQLVQEDIRASRMLACGLFARGPAEAAALSLLECGGLQGWSMQKTRRSSIRFDDAVLTLRPHRSASAAFLRWTVRNPSCACRTRVRSGIRCSACEIASIRSGSERRWSTTMTSTWTARASCMRRRRLTTSSSATATWSGAPRIRPCRRSLYSRQPSKVDSEATASSSHGAKRRAQKIDRHTDRDRGNA
eukprot:scaffold7029_cov375-Pinguiococcus_pyrenoidosus.AAC.20